MDIEGNKSIIHLDIESNKSTIQLDIESNKSIIHLDIESNKSTLQLDIESNKSTIQLDIESNKSTIQLDIESNKSIIQLDIESNKNIIQFYTNQSKLNKYNLCGGRVDYGAHVYRSLTFTHCSRGFWSRIDQRGHMRTLASSFAWVGSSSRFFFSPVILMCMF
ncbi:hypothetical protein CHS0354_014322 [Potamilus streckersoni]|uniref:Uncharacterized protein n=1 Tax=Potamilus streckersoni TaxID=2493646 RepID=A0AAE0SKQ0_9BIVA|nr:hypothetical protein CHS0354_014322 [Potamilus streckersoni]